MTSRHRELPSWMAMREGEKLKEKQTRKSKIKRKRDPRTAFYCMNEKELVEAAIVCLTGGTGEDRNGSFPHNHKAKEDRVTDSSVKIREKHTKAKKMRGTAPDAVEPSSDSNAQERTYVSETDLDIAEVETIPYIPTKSTENQRPEGQRSGGGHSGPTARGQEAGRTEDHSDATSTTADDDALRLVREIFFS